MMRRLSLEKQCGVGGLRWVDAPIPCIGPRQVLVRPRAWSLNFRDLLLAQGRWGPPLKAGLTPGSDCAGEVVEVGAAVTRWRSGDRVVGLFAQDWLDGPLTNAAMASALGGAREGVFAEYVAFSEHGLARIPAHLGFEEAATLPCAALAAWNGLIERNRVRPGQTVLIQGTGAVSLFGGLFAHLSGATVILTSRDPDRLERASAIFPNHGIVTDSAEWSDAVRRITDGGVDHVLEVGGSNTLQQSVAATRTGGKIALLGVLTSGGSLDTDKLMRGISLNAVFVGNAAMFNRMAAFIGAQGINPVIDRRFEFGEFIDAYRAFEAGGHFGKIVIKVEQDIR